MSMQWTVCAVLATSLLFGCSATVSQSTTPMPGQKKFDSKPKCARTETQDRFDSRCDVPLLGYSGFSGL